MYSMLEYNNMNLTVWKEQLKKSAYNYMQEYTSNYAITFTCFIFNDHFFESTKRFYFTADGILCDKFASFC